ncbi:hypothetical protein BX667DRAFT_525297 [Coemansia mojavensis]|nr:hypothetical protein BX667DRAFT_525297 [Coemansia mojavensis]
MRHLAKHQSIAGIHDYPLHRKPRLSSYPDKEQADARLARSLRDKFQDKPQRQDPILISWSGSHMKCNEPIRSVGMRDMLRKHGFTVYLIDEYRTSSLCPLLFTPTDVFFKRPSPKPGKEPDKELKQYYCRGLLRCTECTVELGDRTDYRKWDRALAAVCNFRTILQSIREGKGIPEHFKRGTEGMKHSLAESSSKAKKKRARKFL